MKYLIIVCAWFATATQAPVVIKSLANIDATLEKNVGGTDDAEGIEKALWVRW